MRLPLSVATLALAALCAACGEDSALPLVGPGYRCDVTNPVREVIAPDTVDVYFHTPLDAGDVYRIPVVVTNRFGEPRTDVPVTVTSSDSSIVTVDPVGQIRPLRQGTAQVTLESCGEKAVVAVNALPEIAPALALR